MIHQLTLGSVRENSSITARALRDRRGFQSSFLPDEAEEPPCQKILPDAIEKRLSFQTFQMEDQLMNLGRWIVRLTGLVEILQLLGIEDGLFQFIAYGLEDVS